MTDMRRCASVIASAVAILLIGICLVQWTLDTNRAETVPCFYLADGKVFQFDGQASVEIPFDVELLPGETREIFTIAWDSEVLFAGVVRWQAEGAIQHTLYRCDLRTGTWTALPEAEPYYLTDLIIADGFLYYMCDIDGTIARISVSGGEQEVLEIQRLFLGDKASVTQQGIYALKDSEIHGCHTLYYDCWETGTITEYPLDESDGYYRLSGQFLYQITPRSTEWEEAAQIRILRTPLPQTPSDSLQWEELLVFQGDEKDSFVYWGDQCYAFYGDAVFYETPDGTLHLFRDGETRALWALPEGHHSAIFQPLYFFGSEYFAVVYAEFDEDVVFIGSWV